MKLFLLLALYALTCFTATAQENPTNAEPLISHVEWSHQSNQILITFRDGGISLFDPITNTIRSDVPSALTGRVEDAALHPNGDYVAIVDRATGLSIWDMQTNSLIYEEQLTLAWQVAWSPNGNWLLTANMGEMYIRDVTGIPLYRVTSHEDDIPDIAFSPDEQFLALSFTYNLEIYDINLRQSVTSNIVAGFRHSIEWNMDASRILAAITDVTADGNFYRVAIIDPFTGERLQIFDDFSNQLTSARWNPNETQILVTSIDGSVSIIDVRTGNITTVFESDSPISSADWSPDGEQIVIGTPVSGIHADLSEIPVQIIILPALDEDL